MKFNPETMYIVVDAHPSRDLRAILGLPADFPFDRLKRVVVGAMINGAPVESSKELRFLLEVDFEFSGVPTKCFLICVLNNEKVHKPSCSHNFSHTLFIKGVITSEEYSDLTERRDITHILSKLAHTNKGKEFQPLPK